MIKIQNLTYTYVAEEEPTLKNIDTQIKDGEYIALIGPNGCGKTTFLRHLNGLLMPSRGDVWVDGLNTKDADAHPRVRQRVGMVFQNPDNQIFGMSVEEDVAFGPGNLGLPPVEIRKRVEKSIQIVGIKEFAKKAPHTLSNGEKQLVAIAGVLAMNPLYIALDEPTSYLDPASRRRILQVVRKLNREGISVIHVTHDMDEVVHADTVMVMNEGEICLNDTPAEVFTKTELLRELGLEIPRFTEFIWRLRQKGVDVRPDILTLDDACHEIVSLINGPT